MDGRNISVLDRPPVFIARLWEGFPESGMRETVLEFSEAKVSDVLDYLRGEEFSGYSRIELSCRFPTDNEGYGTHILEVLKNSSALGLQKLPGSNDNRPDELPGYLFPSN